MHIGHSAGGHAMRIAALTANGYHPRSMARWLGGVRETILRRCTSLTVPGSVPLVSLAGCIANQANTAVLPEGRAPSDEGSPSAAASSPEDQAPPDPERSLPRCTAQPSASSDPDSGPSAPPGSAAADSGASSDIVGAKEAARAGMVKPRVLCAPAIAYSRDAIAHRVGGVALVKCVIELDGSLSDCRIVKGLPYMDDQILASMRTWRYTPVLFKGRAVRVEMIIPVRLPVPPPPKEKAASD
jgi:protein TonB